MTEQTVKLRVAIVGGGTVGLSLALYLNQLDTCDLSVYEGAKAFTTIGAGIEISHNAMKVYQEMGFSDTVYELAAAASGDASNVWFDVRFGDGRNGAKPICTPRVPVGNTKLHRADALDLLVSRLPKEKVFLGKHLETYERNSGGAVTLTFTDGSTAEADVLVGADGIKSRIRRVMYGEDAKNVDPRWSGCIAYRGLLPMEMVVSYQGEHSAHRPNLWMGNARHIVQYPVSRGQSVNLAVFVTDFDHGRYPEWKGTDWIEQSMLRSLDKPLKWAVFELPPLPSYVSGNVALIGDAAHAALPHQGNGASQGIEDAHVLASLLSHPRCTKSAVPLALKAYDAVRRPRSQRLQQSSFEAGRLFECVSDAGENEQKIAAEFDTMMDWVWSIDINAQRDRALRLFEESLSNLTEYVMTE
ncbi:salicylate hydroxylase [Calocera viscosa TUFC12733]|uniref:Salicylate hydroxylase n=1 Tax=Calocera viscosa (strain TUFC12733) TaxID=1330018 RepID=A0A167HF99_CALVF|nr:salicylate hydroxylase [Calocera viscosa TUFC12733]